MLRSASSDAIGISGEEQAMNTVPRINPAAAQPVRAQDVDQREWETRVDLAACYRLVDLYGMCDLHLNHISARVPGEDEHFLINPFGMMYEEITASSLIKVDHAGNIISNSNPEYSVNLAGYVIHSAIHAARPDVGCVLHTHTNAGMAVSVLKCGLLPLTQTAMRWSRVAYHDFEGVAVDLDERKRLADDLGDSDVMILRNHGLLAVGQTIGQAFNNIYRLERACQTQLLAMACNAEIITPAQDVIARSNAQLAVSPSPDASGKNRAHGSMEWPALKRMLDRRDPSYKN
jgi:ribulose-5-phosphate 4-epimerase/fuculose-1-phosphate aldolase